MLSIQKQPACRVCDSGAGRPKYLRKTVRLPNGSFALVVFEMIEVNGKVVAKAVYGKILGQTAVKKEETLSLPVYFERQSIKPLVSPFFSYVSTIIKDLSFITSQQTRAPGF